METIRVGSAPAGGFTTAKHDLRKRARYSVLGRGFEAVAVVVS